MLSGNTNLSMLISNIPPTSRYLTLISVTLFVLWGVLAGLYPLINPNFFEFKIGHYVVFDRPMGFRPISLNLPPEKSPIRMVFVMIPMGNYHKPNSKTDISLTLYSQGKVIANSKASFSNIGEKRGLSPDPVDKVFYAESEIFKIENNGTYTIDAKMSGPENLSMRRIYAVLISVPEEERVRKIEGAFRALFAAAIVVAGLACWARHFAKLDKASSSTVTTRIKPKWGRDAAES